MLKKKNKGESSFRGVSLNELSTSALAVARCRNFSQSFPGPQLTRRVDVSISGSGAILAADRD